MPTKQVIDLHRIATSVTAGALHNRERITEALIAQLEEDGALEALSNDRLPEPPEALVARLTETAGEAVVEARAARLEAAPEAVPDIDGIQRFAAWAISFYAEKMMQLDDLHQQERQQDWVPRAKRDEATEAAYQEYVKVRRMMTAALAPETVASILGLEGETPRNPFVLADKLRFAVQRMSSPETYFPDIQIAGLAQNWPELVQRLSSALTPLDAALQELELETKAAHTALLDKRRAIRRYRAAYRGWTGILRGLYTVAGEAELARRLSPTIARRTSDEDLLPEDDEPTEGEEPTAEPPLEEDSPDLEPPPGGESSGDGPTETAVGDPSSA